jgi:ubiquinone/menaquinone biosynthesis C-methylase UbiE
MLVGWDIHRARHLNSAERRAFEDPAFVLTRFGLGAGMTVLDIGAGTGFYAHEAARLVSPGGTIIAVDESAELLDELRATLPEGYDATLITIHASAPPLPDGIENVDLAVLANLLHELRDDASRARLLADVRAVLAPGGTVGIVEWKKEPMPFGPPLEERLSAEEISALLSQAGFALIESFPVSEHRLAYRAEPVR